MATRVELANRALTLCGALRIADVNDPSKSGRAIAATYEGVRDGCLSIANWRFAMSREPLANTTAQDGYSYAYIIPSTWLRLVSIRDRYVGAPLLGPRYIFDAIKEFAIEKNRTLLTNYGPPLKCIGVEKITDESQFDPLFNNYFVECLAIAVWEDVSRKGASKLSVRMEERDRNLQIARVNNAIQEAPEEIDDTSWLLSRIGP